MARFDGGSSDEATGVCPALKSEEPGRGGSSNSDAAPARDRKSIRNHGACERNETLRACKWASEVSRMTYLQPQLMPWTVVAARCLLRRLQESGREQVSAPELYKACA